MNKARENGGHPNAKVVGRYLIINNEKYDHKNILSYLEYFFYFPFPYVMTFKKPPYAND